MFHKMIALTTLLAAGTAFAQSNQANSPNAFELSALSVMSQARLNKLGNSAMFKIEQAIEVALTEGPVNVVIALSQNLTQEQASAALSVGVTEIAGNIFTARNVTLKDILRISASPVVGSISIQ